MIGLPVTLAFIGMIDFGNPSMLMIKLSLNNPQISFYKVTLISTDLLAGRFPKDGSQVNAIPLLEDKYKFEFFSNYLATGNFSSIKIIYFDKILNYLIYT